VAGGAGDGGMGKGRFFLFVDCLIVAVEAGEVEKGDKEIKKVVYVDSSVPVD
jgi:hypothetical protein